MACKACGMPKDLKKDCSCPLKDEKEKKICEVKIQKTSNGCTIVSGEITKSEAWRKRALKELQKALNTSGSINQKEIVLRGVHEPAKIVEILQKLSLTSLLFLFFMLDV